MQKIKKISIYDFNPRYFKDNTGTGTGDFRGLASKFEYFSYLGVDAVILQDVLSSNSDSKFQSFTDVSPELGDMNGLQLVISHARKHKIKLFIELKIGGIKQSHNWYTLAKQESDLKFGTLVDFNKSKEETPFGAKYDKDVKAYVSVDQSTQEVPLNWNSERTIEKFLEVVRFWKGLGINGFVFKDFEYISDKTRTNSMSEATLTDLRKFYRAIKEVDSKIMVIGKSGIVPLEHISEYTTGRTKVFDYLQTTRLSTNGTGHKFGNDEIGKFKPRKLFSEIVSIAKDPSTIVSLGSEDTGRIVSRWGDDGQYRNESAKSLAILSFLTPASNTIYYADELGAKNIGLTHLDDFQDKTLKQRKNDALERKLSNEKFMDAQVLQNPINGRSLMMWNSKKNGGFSVAEKTITPASTGYVENNVEVQHNDDTSILNFYKKLNKIIHSSTYAKILTEGTFKASTKVSFGSIVKLHSVYGDKELITYINLSSSTANLIAKPKAGKVILSTYSDKSYNEIPKKLEAYESIIISKNTDESIKRTQEIKLEKIKADRAQSIIDQRAKEQESDIKRIEKEEKARLADEAEQNKADEARIQEEQKAAAKESLRLEELTKVEEAKAKAEAEQVAEEIKRTEAKHAQELKEQKELEDKQELENKLAEEKANSEVESFVKESKEEDKLFESTNDEIITEIETKDETVEEFISETKEVIEEEKEDEIIFETKEIEIEELVSEDKDATEDKDIVEEIFETTGDAELDKDLQRALKEEQKTIRNLEKTRIIELKKEEKQQSKFEKYKLKEEKAKEKQKLKEERILEKTRTMELPKEAKASESDSEFDAIKRRMQAETSARSSIIDDLDDDEKTSLQEKDIAATTQVDMDDIDDIEEFLNSNK